MQTSFAAKDLQIETLAMISEVIGPTETRELLQSLVDSFEPAFGEMSLACKSGDFVALARAAHRLAGGCGSLGAMQMQAALRDIESAALAESAHVCEAGLRRLLSLADKLRSAAADYSSAEAMAG